MPTLKITAMLGSSLVEATGETLKSVMDQIGFLAEIPSACPICAQKGKLNVDLAPFSRRITAKRGDNAGKTFQFYGVRCKPPLLGDQIHENQFGEHLEGKGFFYKSSEWKDAFKPGDEDGGHDERPAQGRGNGNQSRKSEYAD